MANFMTKVRSKKSSPKSSKIKRNSKFTIKNLNFRKNWKKLSYLGLTGFLIVTSMSYGVWQRYEEIKASAIAAPVFLNRKDQYGYCAGSTLTLQAKGSGDLFLQALAPNGTWRTMNYKAYAVSGTTVSVSKEALVSLGGSGVTRLRGVQYSGRYPTPYVYCTSSWGPVGYESKNTPMISLKTDR